MEVKTCPCCGRPEGICRDCEYVIRSKFDGDTICMWFKTCGYTVPENGYCFRFKHRKDAEEKEA